MDKIKVVVVASDIEYRVKLKNLLTSDKIAVLSYINCDDSAFLKINGFYPDVVICCYEKNSKNIFTLTENIYSAISGCAILMISENVELELVKKAMQSGVREVLPANITENELEESITRACLFEKQRLPDAKKEYGSRCKVISFFGGKGGTGKTTVAVNLAVCLSDLKKKTVIIDCDLQYGDVNLLLDIEPKDTIAELVQESSSFSIDLIKNFFVLHSSGVSVLCAPKSPEYAEFVTAKHVESIINILRSYYDYVLIDLSPNFSDITISAIENSDEVFLVSGLDISSLRNAKICTTVLESLQQKDKIRVIINKANESIITVKDYEKVLELKVLGSIPEDTKITLKSLNNGIPLVIYSPRSPSAKALKGICEKIVKEQE